MILVTGGAGYIGSQIVRDLAKNGLKIIVIDNLELGHKNSLSGCDAKFFQSDFSDAEALKKIFSSFPVEAVVHLAAYSEVGESAKNPEKYFKNNVENSKKLLEAMKEAGVKKFIFSSSASVYGEAEKMPIKESAPTKPINIYGQTKLEFEKILANEHRKKNLDFIALRYFNAAGAELDGSMGEDHNPESHLIPRLFKTIIDKSQKMEIFGNDYPTPDGTCIRDYIHIKDIASAHIYGLNALLNGGKSDFYNVGTGKGYSVKEIMREAEKASGQKLQISIAPRRKGDPAMLVTSNEKIQKGLGWKPRFSDIETITASAWKWHKNHPEGYNDK